MFKVKNLIPHILLSIITIMGFLVIFLILSTNSVYAQTLCTRHSYKQCSYNQIYWYDSCDNRQDLFQDCGDPYFSTHQFMCLGNILQKEDIFNSCQDASCIHSHQWTNYTDCALYNQVCQLGQCINWTFNLSCDVSPNPAKINQRVYFTSWVLGGVGGYSFRWTGACDSYASGCDKSFSQPGDKTVFLAVTSGGHTLTATCSVSVLPEPCECSNGLCCDGCHYKNTSSVCNTETQTEYGCPQGSACGSDVGVRTKTRNQYCSGYSNQCTGNWSNWTGLSDWRIVDYCSINQTCLYGTPTCQVRTECAATSFVPQHGYILHYIKGCYDNDLYWYDSQNIKQDKYSECQDNNACTQDICSYSECSNKLVCNGTTCGKDSADYCNSCNHCGDGVCSCDETISSCQQDCSKQESITKEGFLAGLLKVNLNKPIYIVLGIIIAILILMGFARIVRNLKEK